MARVGLEEALWTFFLTESGNGFRDDQGRQPVKQLPFVEIEYGNVPSTYLMPLPPSPLMGGVESWSRGGTGLVGHLSVAFEYGRAFVRSIPDGAYPPEIGKPQGEAKGPWGVHRFSVI